MSTPEFDIRPLVLSGDTADVHSHRTIAVLRDEGLNPMVTMEFWARREGVLCGIQEVRTLLHKILPEEQVEVWSLEEGAHLTEREVALRIKARYVPLGLYETAICGILASCSGWATAAQECVQAAGGRPDDGGTPIISFGARHVHPNVAGVMDYSAITGGCVSCSSVLGAKLAGIRPSGTMSHSLTILMGDTVRAVQAFDSHMPPEVPRIVVVGTLKDETEESLNVARQLRDRLRGIRLDTARELGGVGPYMVKEVRARLDQANFNHVEITVSGGITPDRIREFRNANSPVDSFGVGIHISSGPPIGFTADIHEVDGKPLARRGRIPGNTNNPHLERIF